MGVLQVRAGTWAWWGGDWVESAPIPDRSRTVLRLRPGKAEDGCSGARRTVTCYAGTAVPGAPPPPFPDQTLRVVRPGRPKPRRYERPAQKAGATEGCCLCRAITVPVPGSTARAGGNLLATRTRWSHWACAVLRPWCGALQVFAAAPSGGGRWGGDGLGGPGSSRELLGLRAARRCAI